jgi:tryptophan-rich sensory protein
MAKLSGRARPIVAAALSATGVAGLGALLTQLGPWYFQLHKPAWQPPDWLFGPAWTLIFALTAIAGVKYWRAGTARDQRELVIAAFALNAFLNTFWSLLFFRLERPDWALLEVPLLWLSILVLIVLLARATRRAAWLLLPYLVWVTFAAVLNWKIVELNSPFSRGG